MRYLHRRLPRSGHAIQRARLAELMDRAARHLRAGRPAGGLDPAREAVELARVVGDGPRLAHALSLLGGLYRLAGEAGPAVPVLTEGAELADKHGELAILADCLSALGYLSLMGGDLADASTRLDRALTIRRGLSDRLGEAECLDYLAFTLHEEGDPGPAEDLLEQAHGLRQGIGDPRWLAVSLNNKAYLTSLRAERIGIDPSLVTEYRQRAVDLLADAERAAEVADHPGLLSFVRANLVAARVAAGEQDPTPAAFECRLADARRSGERGEEALALYNLGHAHFRSGSPSRAQALWQQAVALAEELGQAILLRDIHRDIARSYEESGDAEPALEHYKRFHELERGLAAEAAAQRAKLAVERLEAEYARRETERYRQLNAELAEANRRLKEQALLMDRVSREDELTRLGNRRYLTSRLPRLYQQARTTGETLAILVADVDHFKAINDEYSHAVGDLVLATVARLLSAAVRPGDLVVRYGGEEFVLVLTDTPVEEAFTVAERLRTLVERHDWGTLHPGLAATVSLGVCADITLGSWRRMIDAADQSMYEAKRSGRNRVH
jgi:diguanylate cyclase (GGDEF)-like protein